MYTVTMIANATRGDMPHYRNAWKATLMGRLAAEHYEEAFDILPDRIEVMSRQVFAKTGYAAIQKFRKWYSNGLDESYLAQEGT